MKSKMYHHILKSIRALAAIFIAHAAVLETPAQLIDKTLAPNVAKEGIAKSLA